MAILTLFNIGLVVVLIALWLGIQEERLRSDHSNHNACKGLKLGEEDMKWENDIRETIPGLEKVLDKIMDARAEGKLDDPNPQGRFKRVQHPVPWGCTKASVEILSNISTSAKYGLFAEPKTFQAVIRLSKPQFIPDNGPKTSSIALKIFGVNGPRAAIAEYSDTIRDANKDTQDFIMIGNPTLPVAVVPQEFTTVHEYLYWGSFPGVGLWMIANRPTLIPRLAAMLFKGWLIRNPFLAPHYTVLPSKLGNHAQAARVAVFPCDSNSHKPNFPILKLNYIHELVQEYINSNEVCMKLMIQRQTDPCADKIDDFLNEWVGHWEHVGYVRVAKGSNLELSYECDNLSFNPFHALEENRPLGWVARLRRDIYAEGSARRVEKNAKHQR